MIADRTAEPTLADRAYRDLERLIVTLGLPPGAVMSESTLGEELQMGRTPLREALQRLASEGLVTTMPRRGMMITPIDLSEMIAIIETRKVLDAIVVKGAAEHATGSDRSRISEGLAGLDAPGERFMEADAKLDHAIWAAAPNRHAVRASRPLHTHCRRFWFKYRNDEDLLRSAELHKAVAKAVLDGDPVRAVERSDKLNDYLTLFTKHILIRG